MICDACRERRHGECRGGTWCDCQHKPPARHHSGDETAAAGSGSDRHDDRHDGQYDGQHDGRPEGASEPGINWLRQG